MRTLEIGFGGKGVGFEPVYELSVIASAREVVLGSMNVCVHQTWHQKLAAAKVTVTAMNKRNKKEMEAPISPACESVNIIWVKVMLLSKFSEVSCSETSFNEMYL